MQTYTFVYRAKLSEVKKHVSNLNWTRRAFVRNNRNKIQLHLEYFMAIRNLCPVGPSFNKPTFQRAILRCLSICANPLEGFFEGSLFTTLRAEDTTFCMYYIALSWKDQNYKGFTKLQMIILNEKPTFVRFNACLCVPIQRCTCITYVCLPHFKRG